MNRILSSLFFRLLELSQGKGHKCTITKPYGAAVTGPWEQRHLTSSGTDGWKWSYQERVLVCVACRESAGEGHQAGPGKGGILSSGPEAGLGVGDGLKRKETA